MPRDPLSRVVRVSGLRARSHTHRSSVGPGPCVPGLGPGGSVGLPAKPLACGGSSRTLTCTALTAQAHVYCLASRAQWLSISL